MIISCWLGADVWMGACCERVVSIQSVLGVGGRSADSHLSCHLGTICYLIGIRNYIKIGPVALRFLEIQIFIQRK